MQPDMSAMSGALKLGFFASSLTLSPLAAHLATADVAPGVEVRTEIHALAGKLDGNLSTASLKRLIDAQDTPLFDRFDPGAKHAPAFGLVHPFEGAAPNLHLFDLAPSTAQAVNSGVPLSQDPNPPARPFILKASAEDRAKAITCLTQAVYFEAGFEPGTGQQAVAQVVLNRMRHPIFPHSVCGVVYQGADLKTGCQFSFTCDGSLAKTPQQAAWDRSKLVAEQALDGYVMKTVGGATHYHTQWVVPWWRPTVSKVALVGAHIFYRWPGSLGLPGAFTMRYAGNERIAATPTNPTLTEAAATADGRIHAELTVAASASASSQALAAAGLSQPPRTPQERMRLLASQHALGAVVTTAVDAPVALAAAKVQTVELADADLKPVDKPDVKIAPVAPGARTNLRCMTGGC